MRRFEDALASYDKAIALRSDYAEAYVNRGHVLRELWRNEAAVDSYDRAIQLKPIYAEAFESRGICLLAIGRIEDAISSYQRALALEPERKFVLGTRRHTQMYVCDWNNLESDLERIAKGVSAGRPIVMPFEALGLFDSAPLHRQAAEIWMRNECPPDDSLGQMPERPRGERIRVGYFSADFRMHPVSLLTAELYERHDRSKFEIMAFALGPEANDPMRARLVRGFDRFIDVRDHSDRQVASLARQLGIDIAVDLGGFTRHSRPKIFALRAAPVQISYIGYLGTMGAPYMDYLIADPTIIPRERQQDYAEKILYLPSYQVNDSQRHIANRIFSRKELGLPQTGFVFSCFNTNYKILQSTFETWMRILKRVEGSVLFLYAENSTAAQNLRKQAHHHSIDTDRIVFGERVSVEYYLARMRSMDLFLDTLPYNAGTTASDALWAGLPVLTCTGQAFAGRVAASLLRAIDLPELITTSPAEYENLAVHLASNPAQLAAIREKLAANRLTTRLFDTDLFTRNLEAAFTVIHERAQQHMPPDHVYPAD
jgi:predicted O-linked N-acetylglucosamine transferase (SPINDLY family)